MNEIRIYSVPSITTYEANHAFPTDEQTDYSFRGQNRMVYLDRKIWEDVHEICLRWWRGVIFIYLRTGEVWQKNQYNENNRLGILKEPLAPYLPLRYQGMIRPSGRQILEGIDNPSLVWRVGYISDVQKDRKELAQLLLDSPDLK